MKRLFTTLVLAATTATACFADARQDVAAAARKLADASSYAWVSTTEIEGGQWAPVPIKGVAEKAGFAVVTSERDGEVTTAVMKGEKGVVKTDDGWKTAEDLRGAGGGGGGRGGGMRAAALLRTQLPAAQMTKLVESTKELKESNGVISGDLTEAGAKELMTLGGRGRGGNQAPEASNAKGSVKFWLKDGQVSKVQVRVSGTISFNGNDRDMERTTTHEIKDVGTAKVVVPDDAKKLLGS
jgi:hypothetical protein